MSSLPIHVQVLREMGFEVVPVTSKTPVIHVYDITSGISEAARYTASSSFAHVFADLTTHLYVTTRVTRPTSYTVRQIAADLAVIEWEGLRLAIHRGVHGTKRTDTSARKQVLARVA
jgi:hypothetical protein